MTNAQTTDAMPTQPSSTLRRGTASMMTMSMNKKTASMILDTSSAFEGTAKNRIPTRRLPSVRVVKETSKKPEPRLCMPGGLTKIETNSMTHHTKVMARNRIEKIRRMRTLQRL